MKEVKVTSGTDTITFWMPCCERSDLTMPIGCAAHEYKHTVGYGCANCGYHEFFPHYEEHCPWQGERE